MMCACHIVLYLFVQIQYKSCKFWGGYNCEKVSLIHLFRRSNIKIIVKMY